MTFSQADKEAALEKMRSQFNAEKAENTDALIQVQLTGDDGGDYWLHIENQDVNVGEGAVDAPRMTLISSTEDFISMVNGEIKAMQAFMSGKLKVKGDMSLAMKLQSIFGL